MYMDIGEETRCILLKTNLKHYIINIYIYISYKEKYTAN